MVYTFVWVPAPSAGSAALSTERGALHEGLNAELGTAIEAAKPCQ